MNEDFFVYPKASYGIPSASLNTDDFDTHFNQYWSHIHVHVHVLKVDPSCMFNLT